MDGAARQDFLSGGQNGDLGAGDIYARAADFNRSAQAKRAANNAAPITEQAQFLSAALVRIFDLGGMDAVETAIFTARQELVRRRRKDIEKEGWIV